MSYNIDKMAALSPDAAPLEQNIKNLECEGVQYKVIKEDKGPYRYVSKIINVKFLATGYITIKKRI